MRKAVSSILVVLACVGTSCMFDIADVRYETVELVRVEEPGASFRLAEDVVIDKAPCNYDRTLRANTTWFTVGMIPEGSVYRSRDQEITVECSNIFEAYLVVNGKELVGAYLPVEKGYVQLAKKYQLPIE